ncbi:hypothetical protein PFFCH_05376 [Plasmodium falciparum FCH/4]|uniref:Spindle assembly abnormal protein 6 N-terminal domain-containing protein n=1 Tax=Plasmodium falciparum FCH/4 TaxID=1036724 RepID=A0A024VEN7_PLAFA|nr:hypothetical protein PFFCH_05376 [Plasmodium falciparum FCH/4]
MAQFDGYNLSYSKEVPFEIRMQEHESKPQEGDELNAQSIKIVLTSETDLFFHFTQTFLAIFTIKQNGIAQLEFIKNMEYKFIELLVCQFIKSSDEITKENITYRYNVIKSKNGIMYNRLKDISILIKTKNPSLLMQLQKTASKQMEIFRNKKY